MALNIGFTLNEIIYLICFYSIGAILGFFSFRYKRNTSKYETLLNCIVTTGLGVFIAYILASFLEEKHYFSKSMNMLVGGLASFGLPDIIIKYFPLFEKLLVRVILSKFGTKIASTAHIDLTKPKDKKNESNG